MTRKLRSHLRKAALLATLGGTALVAGCSGLSTQGSPSSAVCSVPKAAATAAQSLASADATFAAALFPPAITSVGATQNVILSPYSLSASLTMVDVGAAGETDSQIQAVLHLPSDATSLAPAYAALACQDETDGSNDGNDLSIADSVWAQQGMTFQSSFLSTLSDGYDAPLQQVDFIGNPTAATNAINAWVSASTQNEIPTLLQPGTLDSTTRIVLVDAVYFKGSWATAFDANLTQDRAFSLADGTQEQVPTMDGDVAVAQESLAAGTLYELGYRGGQLAMDFLVPATSLASLEASLTPAVLGGISAALGTPGSVELQVPKFSFSNTFDFIPVLQGLGMTDVFEPNVANLSGMDGTMDLYVKLVVQQAIVEVDETGTVAAAATASGVSERAGGGASPPLVQIRQPFAFLIRDTTNGSVLFMGQVQDPLR